MRQPGSIILIIPYFGRWPFWMSFFIESCRLNKDINWLLVGDCAELADLPRNVAHKKISFHEYCEFVSSRLGFTFAPDRAYKLCDLKVALGHIHHADIVDYEYWGFSDLDLIYGDLRSYFTAEKLRRYSFFSMHERRVAGHLCLMRNERKWTELFWRIPKYRERVQDTKSHALDEGAFTRLFLWRKNFPLPLFKLLGLFNPLLRQSQFEEAFSTPNASRAWTDGSMNFPSFWHWQAGKLYSSVDGVREFPYLHFYTWKRHWAKMPQPSDAELNSLAASHDWLIDETGFQSWSAK
jgi:hypothetical protein